MQKTGETRRLLPSEVESRCSQDLLERMEWLRTVPQSRKEPDEHWHAGPVRKEELRTWKTS